VTRVRLTQMGVGEAITIAAILALAGCGQAMPGAGVESGVSGRVLLGPQCPVEVAGHPCEDQPAAHVAVIVFEQIPGDAMQPAPRSPARSPTHGLTKSQERTTCAPCGSQGDMGVFSHRQL
jgi:hypothetical protein